MKNNGRIINKNITIDNIDINLKNPYLILNFSSYINSLRFLKTKYQSNNKRFESRFLSVLSIILSMEEIENKEDIINFYINKWESIQEFSYKEAFSIKNSNERINIFSVINVPEMIKNLGSKRIKTEGIELINKVYNSITGKFINKPFTQIYELHKVNGEKLDISKNIFAVKAWCTSTNDEHWLWVDENSFKNNCPLEAIASTCRIYKSMLNNIKHIIRQGDVFLFEMLDGNISINNNQEIISLDKKTYFKLLKSQS